MPLLLLATLLALVAISAAAAITTSPGVQAEVRTSSMGDAHTCTRVTAVHFR
jgi:hypothetical protein